MNFLSKMGHDLKQAPSNMLTPRHADHGVNGRGFLGFLVDKGERYGTTFALGYYKGKLGDRFEWRGHGIDAWLGGAGVLGAALLNIFGRGSRIASLVAPHVERVGDAAAQAWIHSWAVGKGAMAAAPALPTTKVHGMFPTVMGAIPSATGQEIYLTPAEMARWSAPR